MKHLNQKTVSVIWINQYKYHRLFSQFFLGLFHFPSNSLQRKKPILKFPPKKKTDSMPTTFNVETSQVYNSMFGLLCLVCILYIVKQKHKHAKHGWLTISMIF